MLQRKKIDVDVIKDVLQLVMQARPNDAFVQSIARQYDERGSLSKKQLEGLHGKASRINTVTTAKLATLEAIIKKKLTRERGVATTVATPVFQKDEVTGLLIESILAKAPQHKRVLFLKAKYDNNEILTVTEVSELRKFEKLLLKK
jgi:predicted hydrolase (HD superfamily)